MWQNDAIHQDPILTESGRGSGVDGKISSQTIQTGSLE